MNKLNIIMIALAGVVFTSCKSLYGKYERPDVKTEGIVREAGTYNDSVSVIGVSTSAADSCFGNLPWRSVFTDPQLQRLIQQGLDQNPDLLNAALNVQMAEAMLSSAKLAFVPQFTFTPQGTISSWDGNKASKIYQLPVNASWSVDLFGQLLSQKRSAQMALLASKDYQLVVKTQIISNIANMYYTLLMLDAQMKVVTDMEALTKETWEKMAVLAELQRGIRSTAVQSAEANYYSVQSQKTDLKRQIRETENALSIIMGQPAQSIERGSFENQQLPSDLSTGVALQMLANRPDVHYAEMSLAQCFYNVETARSRFYPSITIGGSGIYTNNSGMGIVNPGKWLLSAVGSLVQPIFMNGQIVAGLKVAKAQYEQAYNTWQSSIFKAGSEVSNALVLYNSSAEKSAVEAHRIKVLEKNVNDTKELLVSSNATYLEVISAQQSLLNAELSKITNDFSKMQAMVSLYYALGGGTK